MGAIIVLTILSGLPSGDFLLPEGLEHVATGGGGGAPPGLGRPRRPGGLGGGAHRRLLLLLLFLLFLLLMTHQMAEGPPSPPLSLSKVPCCHRVWVIIVGDCD